MLTRICLLLPLMTNMTYAADTIVINAKVITVDRDHPAAEAFAIDNGRFTAVGTNAEILALKTPGTKVVDLKGMTVTPGFNDTHVHPQEIFPEGSVYYRVWLGPNRVKTMDEFIAALQRKAAITPAGKMIGGYGYNGQSLGRHPNRHDLDKVSTRQAVVVTHGSGHITVVNTFVLEAAGIIKRDARSSRRSFRSRS